MQFRFAIAAAVILVATPALSADFPTRRAGLWDIAIHLDSMKMGTRSTQMCVDNNTDAKLMKYGMSAHGSDCEKPNIQGAGNSRIVDSVCHINGGTQKSHMVVTYTGDSSYHMDIQTQFVPPLYGHDKSHQTQDAKWMGPCPAGMKAGDMQMMGGMKVNVLDAMEHPVPASRGLTQEQIQAIIKAHGGR